MAKSKLKRIKESLSPTRKFLSRRFRVLKLSPNWRPWRSNTRLLYSIFLDDPPHLLFWKPGPRTPCPPMHPGDVIAGTFSLYYCPELERFELRHGRGVKVGRIETRSTEGEQHSDRYVFVSADGSIELEDQNINPATFAEMG